MKAAHKLKPFEMEFMPRLLILDPPINTNPDLERTELGANFEIEFVSLDRHHHVAADILARGDAIINFRGRHKIGPAQAAAMSKAQLLVQAGVGYNHIDLEACAQHGLAVCNTPDYGTMEVADHALALALNLVRGIAAYNERLLTREDAWSTDQLALRPLRRLRDLTFGIVGLGRIGAAAAQRARAFSMDVCFYDPLLPPGAELSMGLRRHERLEDLLADSDILSLHCPLLPSTKNLIDHRALAAMKQEVVVVNTARGPILDLDALEAGLRADKIAAIGLDVLPIEPLERSHPLIQAWTRREAWLEGRMVITPHAAFYTPQSLSDMRRLSARAVADKFLRGRFRSLVNGAELARHGFELS